MNARVLVALGAVMFCLSAWSDRAVGQGVQSSSWRSHYFDYQGNIPRVDARLDLQGQAGVYYPGGAYARLSNLTYRPSQTGGTLVSGSWSYANTQGWFAFDVAPDGGSFNGSWGYGVYSGQSPVGGWRGVRIGAPPSPVPAPVPVPFPG